MAPKQNTRPNVIFILTDDQGPWAAGCCGNPEIRTPNIDRLAREGVRFENFFVATPVCSPSRATYLTGRIPSQHGVHDYLAGRPYTFGPGLRARGGQIGPEAIRNMDGEIGYTDIMARHGWACALSGKWHLGDNQIPQLGFSHWFIRRHDGGKYPHADMIRNGEYVDIPRYVTDVITDEALTLIDRYTDSGTPFYISVHHNAPHAPFIGHPQDVVDSYDGCAFESCPQEPIHPWAVGHALTERCLGDREMLKGYFAAVTGIDTNVGRILDKLEKRGIRENTLVIYASDNGFSCGHHGFWGKGNGTQPRNMYENSVRVPAIFSHTGSIPQGRVEDALVSAYDFMPTLLSYLDLPVPEDRNLPGTSFLPLLRGEDMSGRDSLVVYDEYGPVRMVRTQDWKYVHRHSHGPHELYDLVNDPGERTNLVDDAGQAKRIAELKGLMDEWFARYVVPGRDGLRRDGNERGQTDLMR